MIKANTPPYNYDIVKSFILAAVIWSVIALGAGVFIAFEMAFPDISGGIKWLSFGRLRPLHTSGVILAFGGNVLFAASFFVVQRTCRARLSYEKLLPFIFWGYQLFLVLAASGYMLGITQGREYAEPEWYADILLTIVWVMYAYVYIATILRREEPHIYVANWFFLAYIILTAILHIGNNISIPLSAFSTKSAYVFSGVQSAMIQWWYGHNMVGFMLTTAFIGIMYYFVPKRAGQPIYSYRLSIMHFWALIFLYIWAGSHHLIYTALPDWAQTLGMTMSLMLWLPSWGGMINGVMTISNSWDKLRDDPVLRFLLVSIAFYGMSTFEGPLMSIKSVNALSHYTEWTISHVHSGALGWVGMISFAAIYHMTPVVWKKKEMHSMELINIHLWLSSIGIVLYITSMWAAGIMQGLMWRSYDEMGFLKYSFIDVMSSLHPYYLLRAIGGGFYLIGACIMFYNVIRTIRTDSTRENS